MQSSECNSLSLLLVERNGMVSRADCPFHVICKETIGELIEGSVYIVTEVDSLINNKIEFQIDGSFYNHSNFLLFHGMFPHEDYKYPNSDLPL